MTQIPEKAAETKKKKIPKKQPPQQNSGVSFALGDRARVKWVKS